MDYLDIKTLYGGNTEEIAEDLYETRHGKGKGLVKRYALFEGIWLYRMDLFVESLDYSHTPMDFSRDLITINHCEKGRFEGEFQNGEFVYLGEGDMAVNMPEKTVIRNSFPLGRFRGIMIVMEIGKAQEAMKRLGNAMGGIPFDFRQLRDRLLSGNQLVIYRNSRGLSRISSQLYQERIWEEEFYLKLKTLELLYYLSSQKEEAPEPGRYFSRNQVQTVKEIRKFLTEHLGNRYTLAELSERFSIPLTSLKECFKAVYGMPVNAYMRNFRLDTAADLLRSTNRSVAEIAEQVGYVNQSKFAQAFRRKMLVSPIAYRNKN